MSRRHETLIPLTHDHHHALAQARRLGGAAASDDDAHRLTAANDFINFYFGRAVRHFHEEEELFFAPLVDDPEARDPILRAVSDHLRLHALVRRVKRGLASKRVDTDVLQAISELLTKHVRFEEGELFPLIERLIPEKDLQELAGGRRDV